ncbi:MAG: hypothetical protein J6X85_06740 [Ruminococcus sp.]|nr:hypothetical protein [Ruminococcus sp.]
MTNNELLDTCYDSGLLTLTIYDIDSETDVWSGEGDDVPTEYGDMEVYSWDLPSKPYEFTVNVCMSDR